ncbi:MAG TPA: YciI family protein [Acidocella sp.]|nr:YciI family protein [Acidocella sp.]
MPLYVLHAKDRPGTLQLRLDLYAAHRSFVEEQDEAGLVTVVMSGPLQTDDGEIMNGSLLLLEAPDRDAVDRFVAEDPFAREGVWEQINVSRFYHRRLPGRNMPLR